MAKNMSKTKNTKISMFTSIISMFLCVILLIGTTFAWFTDSVTSGTNTIEAGNLDIELFTLDEAGNYSKEVNGDTKLFNNNTKWEPGHAEVVYLKIKNAGTLALKYRLSLQVSDETASTNINGETIKLSDVLKLGIVPNNGTPRTPFENRADAIQAVENTTEQWQKLSGKYDASITPSASDSDLSSHYIALVVYMPDTVGNEANYAKDQTPPSINMGIKLVASQTPYEEDSFGKDYDSNAFNETVKDVNIDDNNFPDAIFQNYIRTTYDENSDGILSEEEIEKIITLDVWDIDEVKNNNSNYLFNLDLNLQGIEYFTSLKELKCCGKSSNIGNNTILGITKLDVSKNTALETLDCSCTKIKELNIGNNTNLRDLNCNNTYITKLNVSNNTALETLRCEYAPIEDLDVSNNTALTLLRCRSTQIKGLDVTNNTALDQLFLNYTNPLYVNIGEKNLTGFGIPGNPAGSSSVSIAVTGDSFNIKDMYPDINLSKISNVTGASFNSTTGEFSNYNTQITYNYDCGKVNGASNDLKVTLTLN